MAHQHVHKKEAASAVAASVSSVVFSVIASSHHWLHVLMLLFLGSSTHMLASMSGIVWLRRAMLIATLITSIYSVYRLTKHVHMQKWMKAMSLISIVVSIGFIIYTLIQFGW